MHYRRKHITVNNRKSKYKILTDLIPCCRLQTDVGSRSTTHRIMHMKETRDVMFTYWQRNCKNERWTYIIVR